MFRHEFESLRTLYLIVRPRPHKAAYRIGDPIIAVLGLLWVGFRSICGTALQMGCAHGLKTAIVDRIHRSEAG